MNMVFLHYQESSMRSPDKSAHMILFSYNMSTQKNRLSLHKKRMFKLSSKKELQF